MQINPNLQIQMEGANSATNWTLGCAENLLMQIGDVPFHLHTHVVECTPFCLLLGCPFQHQLLCCLDSLPDGTIDISVCDPRDPSCCVHVPFSPCNVQVTSIWVLSYMHPTPPSLSNHYLAYQSSSHHSTPPLHNHKTALMYKKVTNKVCPVPASLPKDFHNLHHISKDPLLMLSPLPTTPPNFEPGLHLTQDHLNSLELNRFEFLWPEELKLL
jgi:hypothetical protein